MKTSYNIIDIVMMGKTHQFYMEYIYSDQDVTLSSLIIIIVTYHHRRMHHPLLPTECAGDKV